MNRLTAIDEEELIDCAICPDDDCYLCANILNAIERLQYYENLESELEKVYGECDGLLETAVKSILKHGEEIAIGKPIKVRLLTDEDVDKWLRWKELSKKGRLFELPCSVGEIVWSVEWQKWCEYEDEYKECDECAFCPYEYCNSDKEYFVRKMPATLSCIANIVWHKENPSNDFKVYLTHDEAEKELERLKNDRE